MKRNFNATVWQEGEWFVAQCLEVDVASQGTTEEQALAFHWRVSSLLYGIVDRHIKVGSRSGFALGFIFTVQT